MGKQEILLESGTNEMELLAFLIGKQTFGINVIKVQSIQQFDPSAVTEMPKAHHALLGMILYRNKTIPLINLSAALDMETKNGNNENRIVIVTEFNNVVNGFLVDGVKRIHRLFWKDFVPMSRVIGNAGASITGSIHVEGAEIMIIDLEQILSVIFPNLAINEVSKETINKSENLSREDVCVFFAEDSNTIRKNVVRNLKKAGYGNIRSFENGQQAFDYLVEQRDQADAKGPDNAGLPHVMISDIEMPQLDGLTLCKKVKSDDKLKQIIVIMFSSLINKQMINRCKSVGADSYITKPEMNKLVDMLDEFCLKNKKD